MILNFYVTYPSKKTSLKMAIIGGRNMQVSKLFIIQIYISVYVLEMCSCKVCLTMADRNTTKTLCFLLHHPVYVTLLLGCYTVTKIAFHNTQYITNKPTISLQKVYIQVSQFKGKFYEKLGGVYVYSFVELFSYCRKSNNPLPIMHCGAVPQDLRRSLSNFMASLTF